MRNAIIDLLVLALMLGMSLSGCGNRDQWNVLEAASSVLPEKQSVNRQEQNASALALIEENSRERDELTVGTQTQRGFINDNVYHSAEEGDIHFSSYIPTSYDGSEPYALFLTLPGWEGLYFQGAGANMAEDFGTEALKYSDKMIVLSAQLNDWGETSARQAIALTEYFLENYNIDPALVYLHGMSGGGETGSLVMGVRPELYAGYLMTASKWDGDLNVLAKARTPVYLAIGEEDSYYGSSSMKQTYQTLHDLYAVQGLTEEKIRELLVLDVREQEYFTAKGFQDQHMGGMAFAHEESVMRWLFSQRKTIERNDEHATDEEDSEYSAEPGDCF